MNVKSLFLNSIGDYQLDALLFISIRQT